jgi:hypothetical protein
MSDQHPTGITHNPGYSNRANRTKVKTVRRLACIVMAGAGRIGIEIVGRPSIPCGATARARIYNRATGTSAAVIAARTGIVEQAAYVRYLAQYGRCDMFPQATVALELAFGEELIRH